MCVQPGSDTKTHTGISTATQTLDLGPSCVHAHMCGLNQLIGRLNRVRRRQTSCSRHVFERFLRVWGSRLPTAAVSENICITTPQLMLHSGLFSVKNWFISRLLALLSH